MKDKQNKISYPSLLVQKQNKTLSFFFLLPLVYWILEPRSLYMLGMSSSARTDPYVFSFVVTTAMRINMQESTYVSYY